MATRPFFEDQEFLQRLADLTPPGQSLYLVGGSVRDEMLGKACHDYDFVYTGDVQKYGRLIARRFNGQYYVLDDLRGTVRVIISNPKRENIFLDLATPRAKNLDDDLRGRDFTINAMAIDLASPQKVIDPLGGIGHLEGQQLVACSFDTFTSDPVRLLRAIRFSVTLNLAIEGKTRQNFDKAVPLISNVTAERRRDELFKILASKGVGRSVDLLKASGLLSHLLPELEKTKKVNQSFPHDLDVWDHSLGVVRGLEAILNCFEQPHLTGEIDPLIFEIMENELGKYSRQINEAMGVQLVTERTAKPLLFLAALYHDSGKRNTREMGGNGKIHFPGHEKQSARLARLGASSLALSNDEIVKLEVMVREHTRVHFMAMEQNLPSRRTIFHFFCDTGAAGVEICLLSLADLIGIFGSNLSIKRWQKEVEVCGLLMEAWWEKQADLISPQHLLNGDELMLELHMAPGPELGMLINLLVEEQASGQINTREEAFIFARNWINSRSP